MKEVPTTIKKCREAATETIGLLNEAVVKYAEEKATQGQADDQYILGNRYYQGLDGFTQNDEGALKWFKKATEQGNAEAMHNLGHMYSDNAFFGNATVATNERDTLTA